MTAARKVRGAADDLGRGMRAREPDNAFLQIDHHQSRRLVEGRERHVCFLCLRGNGVILRSGGCGDRTRNCAIEQGDDEKDGAKRAGHRGKAVQAVIAGALAVDRCEQARRSDGADILRRPLQPGGGAYLLGRSLDINGRLRRHAERTERDTEERDRRDGHPQRARAVHEQQAHAASERRADADKERCAKTLDARAGQRSPAATTDIGSVTSPAPALEKPTALCSHCAKP